LVLIFNTPFNTPSDAATSNWSISSLMVALEATKVKSTTDTLIVGTRMAKPSIKKGTKQDQAKHNQPTYNAKHILENQVNDKKWRFQKQGVVTENKSQIENTSDLYQPSMYVQQNRFAYVLLYSNTY
jgi:hypothetical protein